MLLNLTFGLLLAAGQRRVPEKKVIPSTSSLAKSVNSFTFKLLDKTGTPAGKNVLISPFSITSALSMLSPGTVGKDQKTLLDVIAPGMSNAELESENKALAHSMLSAAGQPLQIANSAWLKVGMPVVPAYPKSLVEYFHAELHDFQPNQASVRMINEWVDEKTKHRITKIIDSLEPLDRLILINAIAFDGKWEHQFDAKQTRKQAFHRSGGKDESVPMMHMEVEVPYVRTPTLRAIRLGYAGGDYSMVLMLPEKGNDAGVLLRSLDASKVDTMLQGMQPVDEVPIALPKFKFSDGYNLNGPLSSLGLRQLFVQANFGGVSSHLNPGQIDAVIHKTFIDVDEKGTKAAAVTGVVVRAMSIRMNPPAFVADRPFAFLIVHNPSHTIVFAGVVNDPSQT